MNSLGEDSDICCAWCPGTQPSSILQQKHGRAPRSSRASAPRLNAAYSESWGVAQPSPVPAEGWAAVSSVSAGLGCSEEGELLSSVNALSHAELVKQVIKCDACIDPPLLPEPGLMLSSLDIHSVDAESSLEILLVKGVRCRLLPSAALPAARLLR